MKDMFSFLITSGTWHIDPLWGLQYINQYIHDVELVSSGALKSFKETASYKNFEESQAITIRSPKSVSSFYSINEIEGIKPNSIAELNVVGAMRNEDGLCSRGMKSLASDLYALADNKNISGFLVNANSGGGESLAGQTLQNAISDIRKYTNKPILAHGDMMGSACYRGLLNSSEIMLSGPSAKAGSIGSYLSLDKRFIERYKEQYMDLYSDLSEDKNKDFRSLINDADISGLLKMVNKSAEIFQKEVKSARNLGSKESSTLKGGTFDAREAKSRGLIDSIGTKRDALNRLHQLIK